MRWSEFSLGRKLWLALPPFLHAGFIFYLSSQSHLPSTPGGDKLAHFVAYGLLGGLIVRALFFRMPERRTALLFIGAVLATLYGISDEFHQSFVPGRDASAADAAADCAGAIFGSAAAVVLYGWLSRRRSPTVPKIRS